MNGISELVDVTSNDTSANLMYAEGGRPFALNRSRSRLAEPSVWLMTTTGPRNGRGKDLASLSHGFTPMNEEEERSTEVEDQYTWGVLLGCFFLGEFC